jgi:hypothetical protein
LFNLIKIPINFFYKWLKKIPILATLLKIANAYAYSGDLRSLDRVAPVRRWFTSIVIPVFVAIGVSGVMLRSYYSFPYLGKYHFDLNGSLTLLIETWRPVFFDLKDPFDKPGQLITSVFPNLLGFGIGVYALVFALAPKSLQLLQSQVDVQIAAGARKEGHALMLNASLAYPLLVITLSLMPGVFQQLNPQCRPLAFITWVVFWYGVVTLVELLGVLFALGEQDGMDKIYPELGNPNDATHSRLASPLRRNRRRAL